MMESLNELELRFAKILLGNEKPINPEKFLLICLAFDFAGLDSEKLCKWKNFRHYDLETINLLRETFKRCVYINKDEILKKVKLWIEDVNNMTMLFDPNKAKFKIEDWQPYF